MARPFGAGTASGTRTRGTLVAVAVLSSAGIGAAPRSLPAQQAFTQQIVLIPPFEGKDRRLGNAVADAVRGRIQGYYKRREVAVIGEYAMERVLERSSIDPASFDTVMVRQLARELRADEVITGVVERVNARIRVHPRLVLTRDRRLARSLQPIDAPTADSAGALVASAMTIVRRQLGPHRRCENGVRAGTLDAVIADARQAVTTLADAVVLRACLVNALVLSGGSAGEVLAEAQRILAVQPTAYWGLDAAARSYDALNDKPNAAEMWLRLAASDSLDLTLARRVLTALLSGGNAPRAKPLVVTLSDANPDD